MSSVLAWVVLAVLVVVVLALVGVLVVVRRSAAVTSTASTTQARTEFMAHSRLHAHACTQEASACADVQQETFDQPVQGAIRVIGGRDNEKRQIGDLSSHRHRRRFTFRVVQTR